MMPDEIKVKEQVELKVVDDVAAPPVVVAEEAVAH